MIRPGSFLAAAAAAAITYHVTRAQRAVIAPPPINTGREAVAAHHAEDTTGMRPDGLPAEHPESMDLELAPADEVWLALISDELWPCDEYQQIVAEDYRQRRDGAS
jgi:hypothetical protein